LEWPMAICFVISLGCSRNMLGHVVVVIVKVKIPINVGIPQRNLSCKSKSLWEICCWCVLIHILLCFTFKISNFIIIVVTYFVGNKWNVSVCGIVLPFQTTTYGRSCFCVSWGGNLYFCGKGCVNCWITLVRTSGIIERKVGACWSPLILSFSENGKEIK